MFKFVVLPCFDLGLTVPMHIYNAVETFLAVLENMMGVAEPVDGQYTDVIELVDFMIKLTARDYPNVLTGPSRHTHSQPLPQPSQDSRNRLELSDAGYPIHMFTCTHT